MKKVLAILLALIMVFALFACGDKAPDTSPSPSGEPSSPSPSAPAQPSSSEEPGRDTTGEIGFFDPNYDYNANERYKFIYLMARSSALYEDFANSFKAWGERMNVDVTMMDTNGDNALFISTLETLAGQYDGFLLDPDSTTYPAVIDKCSELGIK